MNPIVGGPTMNPMYPIPVTVAIPGPGFTDGTRPPPPKTRGMITDSPAPAAPNPGKDDAGVGAASASSNPNAASKQPARTVRIGPSLLVIMSPRKRNPAIAPENTAYPAAAIPGPAASDWRR